MTDFKSWLLRHENVFLAVLFLLVACWFSNYLFFQGFGLYYDDWPAMANHAKFKLFAKANNAFDWFKIWPHGRPLGWFFLSVLGAPARIFEDISYLYVVGFFIVSIICVLIFFIVSHKYGKKVGLVVALLFMLSPVDTTRIHLTMNYIAHSGLIFSLLAIICYQQGHKSIAYLISIAALLCYESTFPIFVAAALLTRSVFSLKTWKKQAIHTLFCAIVFVLVQLIRYFVSGFHQKEVQQGAWDLVVIVFSGISQYTFHFFEFFFWGIKRGYENIDLISLVMAISFFAVIIYVVRRNKVFLPNTSLKQSGDLFIVGFILLILGLILSGLASYYPQMPWGGVNTRVYMAATFGGAVFMTALFSVLYQITQKAQGRYIADIALLIVLLGLVGNNLRIQRDYVEAWGIQKQVLRSSIDMACDAKPGDTIILLPQPPKSDKGRAIGVHGFGYSTAIADIFDWGKLPLFEIPRIMKAQENWNKELEFGKDGNLHWKKQQLSGYYNLAMASLKPGTIIFLRGTKQGLVRENRLEIDGVNILKVDNSAHGKEECLFRTKPLTGPLAAWIYPDMIGYR